jgi:hypothetical protein
MYKLGLLLLISFACTSTTWRVQELSPHERALLGCYELMIGPWPDSAGTNTLRLLADSLARQSIDGPPERRVLYIGEATPRAVYWASQKSDSISLLLAVSQAKRGAAVDLALSGDSLTGRAVKWSSSGWLVAPAHGRRFSCTAV